MINLETFRKQFITCPYCGHENRDSWEYAGLEHETEIECSVCGGEFYLEVEREVYYNTTTN